MLVVAACFVLFRGPTGPDDYERDAWEHWIDADSDCQDTRQEVLIAESRIPVTFADPGRCRVASGRWRCPYTGRVFTDPSELDVDHLVPLHAAHRAGGKSWSARRRRDYANDLQDPDHLVAVGASANRSKGDKEPHRWMPEAREERCRYLDAWTQVKERWDLEMEPAELLFVRLGQWLCRQGFTAPPATDWVHAGS